MLRDSRGCSLSQDTNILAGIIQFYYLRLGIFFGCMGIFTWLIRGEVVQKSLHYYFLAPIRRELLVLGKFAAGVVTAFTIFGTGVFLSFFFMYFHFGPIGQQFIFQGPGLGHLTSYLLVTALACVGYGALFLALSLVLRNPIIPGIIILGWETISGVLPPLLQKLSVTFYLKHLSPVQVPGEGLMALFTVVVAPVPQWLAIAGLCTLAGAVVAFACFRIRRFEISYSTD
jgi:ABC-type transport system involved in multi-copper enzyme maturation permease subunit